MSKADYLAKTESGQADQFVLFRDNITPYLGTLELLDGAVPIPEITQQAADATYYRKLVDFAGTMQQSAQGWNAWKTFVRDGSGGLQPNPVVLTLPVDFPVAPPPGILPRYRYLVKRVKSHKNCTPAIRQMLSIDGPEVAGPDFDTFRPVFVPHLTGGQVAIPWTWQGYYGFLDSIEILVDRADGKGFVLLTIDTTAGYTDTAALPATSTKWTYKAIYRVGDQRVGQWSAEEDILVGG